MLTLGTVEPQLTLEGTAASFVKIEPGPEGRIARVLLRAYPSRIRIPISGRGPFIVIEQTTGRCRFSGGELVLFLAVLLAETNAAFRCVHAYIHCMAGPCPELFTCRQAQVRQTGEKS